MKKYLKQIWTENSKIRKVAAVALIIVGLLSIITPFTPLGFLLILGLGIFGIKTLAWKQLKNWFKKR